MTEQEKTSLWIEIGGDGTFERYQLPGVHYSEVVDALRQSVGGTLVISGITPDSHRYTHCIPLDRFRVNIFEDVELPNAKHPYGD